jgi:hypothetical protein
MPRPKQVLPTYRHHKHTNTARCWVGGKWVSLGRYDSPESRAEYARLIAELGVTTAAVPAPARSGRDLTVAEVLLAFWRHAEQHYRRPDGTVTNELDLHPARSVLCPVNRILLGLVVGFRQL